MTFDQHPHVMALRIAKVIYDCDLLLAAENLGAEDRIRITATRLKWLRVAKDKSIETKVVIHCTYEMLGLRIN